MNVKPRLGRGLDALLGESTDGTPAVATDHVPVSRIERNPHQPRKSFDDDELAKLAASIKANGVLQPLVVRSTGDNFQLIAGERRLRAAQLAGLNEIPIRVVDFNDQQVLEAALVENIQRSDLNPIEKAQGFKEYLDRFGLKQEQFAERVGLDRTTISNLIGLLNLPAEVQEFVRQGQLSLGHAKVLKGLHDAERQITLAKETIARSLSVHALEQLAKQVKAESPAATPAVKEAVEKTAHVQSIEDEMRQKLSTRVQIKLKTKDKGQIILGFDSNDDFERIIQAFRKAG